MRFRRPPVMASERPAVRPAVWPTVQPAVWPAGQPAVRPAGQPAVRPAVWPAVSACRAAPAAALLILTVGCGSPGSGTSTAATACGTTRTAANVPVTIQVTRGRVSCTTALSVERQYARVISEGQAPGNGGGGPVRVSGWTCTGFPTPVVLKTGQASKCVQDGDEILAILPAPA